MSLTCYIYINNDVSWNQTESQTRKEVFRKLKNFSDVVALPKRMLRENKKKWCVGDWKCYLQFLTREEMYLYVRYQYDFYIIIWGIQFMGQSNFF